MTEDSKSPNSLPSGASDAIPVAAAASPAAARTPRQITSANLLQGDREIQIVHGEEVYRLSVTRQGKLILHK